MFTSLYEAFREHRGLGRFVRIALTNCAHKTNITFNAPVNAVLTVVAGVARVFGMKKPATRALAGGPPAATV